MNRSGLLRALILVCIQLVLLAGLAVAAVLALNWILVRGWLPDPITGNVLIINRFIAIFWAQNEMFLRSAAQIVAGAFGAVTTVYGLIRTWHYLEAETPVRFLNFVKFVADNGRLTRQPLLIAATVGATDDSFIPPSVNTNALSRLKRIIRAKKASADARWLVASIDGFRDDVELLQRATEAAKHRIVTAHLVKGRYFAGQGKDTLAAEEFASALEVCPSDIDSLSAAAACERRRGNEVQELKFLERLHDAASAPDMIILWCQCQRRRAELLFKRDGKPDWDEARRTLAKALQRLGRASSDSPEAYTERGRLLTAFCEARIQLDRTGRLRSFVDEAVQTMTQQINDVEVWGEEGGSRYGAPRARRMQQAYLAADPKDITPDADDETE